MFTKEVKTEFHGHQIVVRTSWGSAGFATEAKLYIDGNVVDRNSESVVLSKRNPVLRGSLKLKGKVHVIEVYDQFIFRLRMKICIDGDKVAGDLK
jgi:hypothetical protein